jgi:hypothetical protein
MSITKYLKGLIPFITMLAGLATIWPLIADLNPRSLEVNVLSQSALTSATTGSIKGLQVSIDGTAIESPFLSVMQISNNGKKPIPASDFEGNLEIRVPSDVKVIRAEVTTAMPIDIDAKITWDTGSVRIAPLLLNPDDSITISVLTSGKRPAFTPRARVAGVPVVKLSDGTTKTLPWYKSIWGLVVAILLITISYITDTTFIGGSQVVYVRKRAALMTMTICYSLGVGAFMLFFQTSGFEGYLWMFGLMMIVVILSAILAGWLNRDVKELATLSISKIAHKEPK